jgi:integrase
MFLRVAYASRNWRGEKVTRAWTKSEQFRFMNAACEKAKLEPLTFHELRHTYASFLVNAGVPLAYVAAQLGHSDTRMVEKHYGHLAPSALADAITKLAPELGIFESDGVAPLKAKSELA